MRSEPSMHTQPHSPPATLSTDDLDRTDELPQLDVAAYEASLTESNKGLSRTDTWTVEALRDIDELAAAEKLDARATQPGADENDAEALTVNVERILKRIAEVEGDIAEAHEANAALLERGETLETERTELATRVRMLEAENARLTEHRGLADEMVQRLERQLRELQSAHSSEHLRTNREREALQREIDQLSTQGAALQENNLALQDQLQAANALMKQRTDALAALSRSLADEKTSTASLARQLASKLKDCENLALLVDSRNRSIEDLTHEREDLHQQLRREGAANAELTSKLRTAQQSLQTNLAVVAERESSLVEKDAQLAQLTTNLERTQRELAAARELHEAVDNDLQALDAAHGQSLSELKDQAAAITSLQAALQAAEIREAAVRQEISVASLAATDRERRYAELEAQLGEARQNTVTLTNERDAAQLQVRNLEQERDALLPASTQVSALDARLAQSAEKLAQLRIALDAAHANKETLQRELSEQADEIINTRARLSEHEAALRALENTVRSRDELLGDLRAQLQTARDERGALAMQLEKSRMRVRSMSEHIFSRDNVIAALQADLAVHTEALAAIRRDVSRIGDNAGATAAEEVERLLEPIEHDNAPILLKGKTFTVGRTTDNDICIPSKLISRNHARLLVGPTGVIVEDAGSTNGCYVNGEQVKHHLMLDGDMLELGDLRYRLRIRAPQDTRARTNVVPFDSRRPEV